MKNRTEEGWSERRRGLLRSRTSLSLSIGFLFGLVSAFGGETAPTSGVALSDTSHRVEFDPALSLAERSFTVEAWVWFDDLSGDKPILAQVGPGDLLHLLARNGRPWLGFWEDDLEGATALQTGRWYHLAYWFDASTLEQRIYVDGVLDGSRTANGPANPDRGRLYAGEYAQLGLYSLDGRLLELRIWDHPRDPQALAADRFTTPSPTAPGLLALYTFEGDLSGSFPDATGTFTQNALVGGTPVSPVRPTSALDGVIDPLPAGSLADHLSGYTYETAPSGAYPDSSGTELTDGLAPNFGWGLPWGEGTPTAAEMGALVGWENQPAEITLSFDGFVQLQGLSLYAMDSDGADGVALPDSVELRTPGGFADTFTVTNPDGSGLLTEIALTNLDLLTDAVTVEATGPGGWIMLGEITADGTVPGPAPATDGEDLPLPAQLFLGLDPTQNDRASAEFRVAYEPSHVDFRFPVASDTFGVEPIPQWSSDLSQWFPLPFQLDGAAGEAFARLQPPPDEGRAFFRLYFPEAAFSDVGLGAFSLAEDDAPFDYPADHLFGGLSLTGRDPASLAIVAVGDQPALLGTPLSTASGGTVTVNADGSFSYTVPDSLAAGQVFNEALTFTVADRLGNSHRRTASFEITGQNDAPVADDDSLDVTEAQPVPPLSLLANDSDPDTGETAQLVVSAINGNAADVGQPITLPTGTLTIPPDGTVTFAPNGSLLEGQTAQETISYTISDPHSATATGTLTIDVTGANNPPSDNSAIALSVTEEDGPAALDPATFTLDVDPGDTFTLTEIAGQPLAPGPIDLPRGTLTIAPGGALSYAPGPVNQSLGEGATATEAIAYAGVDAGGLPVSGIAEVTITGVNDPPVAQADQLDVRYQYYDDEFYFVDIYEGDFASLDDITSGTLVSQRLVHSTAPAGEVLSFTGPDPDTEYGVVITGTVNLLFPNVDNLTTERTVTHTLTIANAEEAGLTVVPGTEHLPRLEEWVDLLDHYGTGNPALNWANGSLSADFVTTSTASSTQVIPSETNAAGDFEVRFRVEAGGPAPTVTYALDDPNHPPVEPRNLFVGQLGSSDEIDLRLNDLDPDDGDTLTVTHIDGVPFTPADNYFDGTLRDWALVPGKGSFLRLPDGRLRFDPFSSVVRTFDDPERFFERTFDVTLEDSAGAQTTASLSVSWEALPALSIGSPEPLFALPGVARMFLLNGYQTDLTLRVSGGDAFVSETIALPAGTVGLHEFLSPAAGNTLIDSWTTAEGIAVQHYQRASGEDAFRFTNPTGAEQSLTFSFPGVVTDDTFVVYPYSSRVRHYPDLTGPGGGYDVSAVVLERVDDQERLAHRSAGFIEPDDPDDPDPNPDPDPDPDPDPEPIPNLPPLLTNPRSASFGLSSARSDGVFSYFTTASYSVFGSAPAVLQAVSEGGRAYQLAPANQLSSGIRGRYGATMETFNGRLRRDTTIANIALTESFKNNLFIQSDCVNGGIYHFTAINNNDIEARLRIQDSEQSIVVPRRSSVEFTTENRVFTVKVGEQTLGGYTGSENPCTAGFAIEIVNIFELGDNYVISLQNNSGETLDLKIVSRQIGSVDATQENVESGATASIFFPMDQVTSGTEADLFVVDDGNDIYVRTFTLTPTN